MLAIPASTEIQFLCILNAIFCKEGKLNVHCGDNLLHSPIGFKDRESTNGRGTAFGSGDGSSSSLTSRPPLWSCLSNNLQLWEWDSIAATSTQRLLPQLSASFALACPGANCLSVCVFAKPKPKLKCGHWMAILWWLSLILQYVVLVAVLQTPLTRLCMVRCVINARWAMTIYSNCLIYSLFLINN